MKASCWLFCAVASFAIQDHASFNIDFQRVLEPPMHHYSYAAHSATLRNDKEVWVHLKAKRTKEYFFEVKEDSSSLRITITPCGGLIHWKLVKLPNHHRKEKLFFTAKGQTKKYHGFLKKKKNMYKVRENSTFEHSLYDIFRMVHFENFEQPPGLSLKYGQLLSGVSNPIDYNTLVREVGRRQMEYISDDLPRTNLRLSMTALEGDTAVTVHVTTNLEEDDFFPRLPRRKRVSLDNITTNSVAVSWEHSPSVNFLKKDDVQYCLVLSDIKDYATYCELIEEYRDPSHLATGNNAFHEKYLKYNWLSSYYNVERHRVSPRVKPFVACSRYKTNFQFEELKPNTKYYISLFVIRNDTGGSLSYEGASFVTRKEQQWKNTITRLVDGQLYASFLNPARAAFRMYEFPVQHFYKHILITVQPCSGYIRVNIYQNGQLLRRTVFEELKVFDITNVKPSILKIKVVNDDNDAKAYKIWGSVKPSRNPYPRLPVDTSIKVLEYGRTCDTITLAWLGSTEKHDYCLYKRMETDDYFKQLILEESNKCQGPPAKMDKVFCRRFQVKNDSEMLMTETIVNLMPATTYRFDLFVSKPNRQILSYRTVWVKTKRQC